MTSQAQAQVPKYEVISNEGAFVPTKADGTSELLPIGSKLKTWMSPGPHLAPLNEAARGAMEKWYDEDHPAADREGRPLFEGPGVVKMWKPHAQFRIGKSTSGTLAPVEVLSIPVKDETPLMGLAEIMAQSGNGNPNQRPPAAFVMPEVKSEEAAPADPSPDIPVVATSIAPSPSTITRKPA